MPNNSIEIPILGILSILAIAINSCVCLLVYKKKKLRTYTNGFVVSLAVSDLLTGVTQFCIYLLGQKVRLFFNITYALSFFGGITTLCGVTWDRYVAVMLPLKYNDIVPKYFKVIISAGWSFTIVIAFMPLTWVLLDGNVNLHLIIHKIYQFITVGLGIIAPYIVIMWAQYRIYNQAKKCVRMDMHRDLFCHKQRSMFQRISLEAKISRIFIIVSVMFFISWFPIIFYTFAFAVEEPQIVPEVLIWDVAPAFIALRPLVNPIIYSFLKPDFVSALREILRVPKTRGRRFFSFVRVSNPSHGANSSMRNTVTATTTDRTDTFALSSIKESLV